MKQWWILRVITGSEYDIKRQIKAVDKECEIYIPRRLVTEYINGQLKQKTERLLPGYVIVGSEKLLNLYLSQGPLKLIGKATEEEIENLHRQEYNEAEAIEVGSKIIVTDGPFAGCRGNILSDNLDDDKTVKCRLVFQGMELEIDLRQDYLNSI